MKTCYFFVLLYCWLLYFLVAEMAHKHKEIMWKIRWTVELNSRALWNSLPHSHLRGKISKMLEIILWCENYGYFVATEEKKKKQAKYKARERELHKQSCMSTWKTMFMNTLKTNRYLKCFSFTKKKILFIIKVSIWLLILMRRIMFLCCIAAAAFAAVNARVFSLLLKMSISKRQNFNDK